MYRLLIADDEALEREGLEWMIGQQLPGLFEVIHAENGRLAIQRAEQYRPDIIFMDIKMPGIEGLEALRLIQSAHPKVKMVLVSAYDFFSYAKEALRLGVRDYILKPARKDQIVEILKKLVNELEEEKEKRDAELKLTEKLTRVTPLVESELALLLMMERVCGTEVHDIAALLGLKVKMGSAMVLSFPAAGPQTDDEAYAARKRSCSLIKEYVDSRMPARICPWNRWHPALT
jgi:two-component system, response regulator YesN